MVMTELRKGDVVTVMDAAKKVGVHYATLYRWIRAGKVIYITFGGIMFLPVLEVERLKKNRKAEAQELAS